MRRFLRELPVLVALALGIALLIKAFIVQAFFIQMESMVPTLHPSDRVLVSKLSYRFGDPERGDVVILHDPHDPCADGGPDDDLACDRSFPSRAGDWFKELFGLPLGKQHDLVKRVIGLPGETISMRNGRTFIDGERIDLPSDADGGPQLDGSDLQPVEIPTDSYYVMGDNREGSSDSRAFGAVRRRDLVGRAFVVAWPPGDVRGL